MIKEYKKQRFAIIGAGPVGGIMGAHLAKAGHSVILVDVLKGHLNEINRSGLTITGLKEMNVPFPAENLCYSIDDMAGRDIDFVFVSVKASILLRILPLMEKVSKPGTTYISLQNGLDTEELIADVFGKENTLRIVVNYGGNRVGDGRVKMNFFNPPNYIGGIDPRSQIVARELAGYISDSGLDTEFSPDIKRQEWEKLILNLGLAALCSLTGKTMKEMMEFSPTRELARELMREGIEVAAACGYRFGKGFLDECMGWLDNTGYHIPSMAMDILEGRPTEIAFLNGKVVEYGKAKEVATPFNQIITSLVMSRELPPRREP
ncbi:MAG: 2-dehydropantoate 2-reductase [Thermoplasmata archaeon]|nr:2-dehydropantoate 2-reductase [Thermoplasmata archaeon]